MSTMNTNGIPLIDELSERVIQALYDYLNSNPQYGLANEQHKREIEGFQV